MYDFMKLMYVKERKFCWRGNVSVHNIAVFRGDVSCSNICIWEVVYYSLCLLYCLVCDERAFFFLDWECVIWIAERYLHFLWK